MIAQTADRLGVGGLTARSWVRTEQCTVVRELHTARVAHLPVRLRDGAGLVGPLVIPGVTSCLGNY